MTQLTHGHEGDTLDVCAQYVIPPTTHHWLGMELFDNPTMTCTAEDCITYGGTNIWADSWLRDKVVSDLLDGAHAALLSTTTGTPATRVADLVADLWKAEGDTAKDLRAELDRHVLDNLDELLSYYSEQELEDLKACELTTDLVGWTPLDWEALSSGPTHPCPWCMADPWSEVRRAIRRRVARHVRSALEIARARSETKPARPRQPRCRRHGRRLRLNPRRSPIASNAPPTLPALINAPRLRAHVESDDELIRCEVT